MTSAIPSREQAISTTELFEHILSFLRPQDLARCREVGRRWQSAVQYPDTSELKQALFIQPVKTRTLLLWDRRVQAGSIGITPNDKTQAWQPTLSNDLSQMERGTVLATLHPLFRPYWRRVDGMGPPSSMCFNLRRDVLVDEERSEHLERSFLTQPPCCELEIQYLVCNSVLRSSLVPRKAKGTLQLRKDAGITVGDVLAALRTLPEKVGARGYYLHEAVCLTRGRGFVVDTSPWVLGAQRRVGGRVWKYDGAWEKVSEYEWAKTDEEDPGFDEDDA